MGTKFILGISGSGGSDDVGVYAIFHPPLYRLYLYPFYPNRKITAENKIAFRGGRGVESVKGVAWTQ